VKLLGDMMVSTNVAEGLRNARHGLARRSRRLPSALAFTITTISKEAT